MQAPFRRYEAFQPRCGRQLRLREVPRESGRLRFRTDTKPLPSALGNFIPQQDANFFELLPSAVEGKKCADLEVARRDVEGAGYLRPVVEILQPLPCIIAVIDDEKFAAGLE